MVVSTEEHSSVLSLIAEELIRVVRVELLILLEGGIPPIDQSAHNTQDRTNQHVLPVFKHEVIRATLLHRVRLR